MLHAGDGWPLNLRQALARLESEFRHKLNEQQRHSIEMIEYLRGQLAEKEEELKQSVLFGERTAAALRQAQDEREKLRLKLSWDDQSKSQLKSYKCDTVLPHFCCVC